jgi:DNA-binding NarL/FixJ family response regulator
VTTDPVPALRILLVDDHALFREGLAGLLRYQSDIQVVGEAADTQAAADVLARVAH